MSFICEVGGGTAGQYFQIYCPNTRPRDISLEKHCKEIQGNEVLIAVYNEPALLQRFVPFGDTIGGDILGWDPATQRGRTRLEYDIVVLPRDARQSLVLANTFSDFVKNCIFGRRFEELVCGGVDRNHQPSWEYQRFTIRKPAAK